jgi:PKD repeat protein
MRIRARRNSVPRDIKFYIHEVDFYVLGGAPSPNQLPIAAFTANPSATTVGSPVSFNGSASSDPDGSIVSYAWQYGDGSTGSGVTTQHAYATAGTYTVRLTVTDNYSRAGDTATCDPALPS